MMKKLMIIFLIISTLICGCGTDNEKQTDKKGEIEYGTSSNDEMEISNNSKQESVNEEENYNSFEKFKEDCLKEFEEYEENEEYNEYAISGIKESYYKILELNEFEDDNEYLNKFIVSVSYFYEIFEDGSVGHNIGVKGWEALESLANKDGEFKNKMEVFKTAYEESGNTLEEEKKEMEDSEQEMTMGQKNALSSAKSYIDYSPFSYDGLIEQLEYEKYSHEDAVFAVDNCGADWNEQAVKSAKSYLDYSSFSKEGLIEQLEFEGFTHEQAVYGAEQNGY